MADKHSIEPEDFPVANNGDDLLRLSIEYFVILDPSELHSGRLIPNGLHNAKSLPVVGANCCRIVAHFTTFGRPLTPYYGRAVSVGASHTFWSCVAVADLLRLVCHTDNHCPLDKACLGQNWSMRYEGGLQIGQIR